MFKNKVLANIVSVSSTIGFSATSVTFATPRGKKNVKVNKSISSSQLQLKDATEAINAASLAVCSFADALCKIVSPLSKENLFDKMFLATKEEEDLTAENKEYVNALNLAFSNFTVKLNSDGFEHIDANAKDLYKNYMILSFGGNIEDVLRQVSSEVIIDYIETYNSFISSIKYWSFS